MTSYLIQNSSNVNWAFEPDVQGLRTFVVDFSKVGNNLVLTVCLLRNLDILMTIFVEVSWPFSPHLFNDTFPRGLIGIFALSKQIQLNGMLQKLFFWHKSHVEFHMWKFVFVLKCVRGYLRGTFRKEPRFVRNGHNY